jgi:hypothetical protein
MRPFLVWCSGRLWLWGNMLETDANFLDLADGGAPLAIAGRLVVLSDPCEYAGFYRRLAALICAGENEIGRPPPQCVADAILPGERRATNACDDQKRRPSAPTTCERLPSTVTV